MPATSHQTCPSEHHLQCSEVWGGNDDVARGVVMPGLSAWVLSKPHAGDVAGGDIHYLSSCATGRIGRILIADVAGHGEQVAALALRLRNLMRRYVNYVDQTKLTGEINREFRGIAEGGRFATAIVATWWGPASEADLTIAGHPTPMVFRAGRGWRVLDASPANIHSAKTPITPEPDNIPLGILDASTYGREKVRLRPGDAILLYTDALVEARAPTGEFLGEQGLQRILDASSAQAPLGEAFIADVYQRLLTFAQATSLGDDATLLLLVPNQVPVPRGSLAMSAAAGARLTKELFASIAARLRGQNRPFAPPQLRADNILGSLFDRFNRRP